MRRIVLLRSMLVGVDRNDELDEVGRDGSHAQGEPRRG